MERAPLGGVSLSASTGLDLQWAGPSCGDLEKRTHLIMLISKITITDPVG